MSARARAAETRLFIEAKTTSSNSSSNPHEQPAYVNAFKAHVNVGFFLGALLEDPAGLLQGTGKRGRHVKLRPGQPVDAEALAKLVSAAYADMQARLAR